MRNAAVKIEQVGLVFVHEVGVTFEPKLFPLRGRRILGALRMIVKFRRIKPLPPLAFAVGLGQMPVIRHAGQRAGLVRTLRAEHVIPAAVVRMA